GSTGDSPVPVGDSPTGRSKRLPAKRQSLLPSGALPVPHGESPGGTGHRPTGIELGESTALFSLSSDGGGGEGRGEESRFYWISPLPARSSQGEGDRGPEVTRRIVFGGRIRLVTSAAARRLRLLASARSASSRVIKCWVRRGRLPAKAGVPLRPERRL